MAGRQNRLSTKPGFVYHSNRGEPPDKKRRTESNAPTPAGDAGDDLWDDDLDFTQDQLENIDQVITMSQQVAAPQQTNTRPASSSRMVGRGTGRSQSAGDVLTDANQNDRKSKPAASTSFVNTGGQKSSRYPSSTATVSGTKPVVPFQYSSTTSKPMGFTPREQSGSARGVSQTKRTGGLASVKGQLTPMTGTTGSDQMSPALPNTQARTEFSDVTQQQLSKLQRELTAMKEENEQLRTLRCQKEGEVHMLRSELQQKREDYMKLKNEDIAAKDQHRAEHIEKEKEMVKEIDKLKIQIQFTERERDELKTRCKVLEKRSSLSSGSNDGQNSPLLSQAHSPRKKSSFDGRSPGPSKGNFPNRDSFMADEAATRSPRRKSVAEAATGTDGPGEPAILDRQKKFSVDTPYQRGRISGPTLVSLMLPKSTGSQVSEQGIVGILQTQQPKCDTKNQSTSKDQDMPLGPTQTNRLIQTLHQQSPATDLEKPDTLIVPDNYYALAVESLKSLLETESSIQTSELLQSHTQNAIYLLPVVESYLSHYLDVVRTAHPAASVTSSVTSLSSPLDSFDSLSSYQRSMAQQTASYTDQVEQWALNALHILRVLVDYSSHVRLALFGATELGNERRQNDDGQGTSEEHASIDEGSSDESTGTSHSSLTASKISAAFIARKCEILDKLMRAANPVLPNEKFASTNIIEVSLQIISVLASQISKNWLQRFEPLLRQDVLLLCLDDELEGTAEQRLRCHLEVLNIVKSLTRSSDVLPKLCSASEDCLLSTFYAMASSTSQSSNYKIEFGLKLIQFLSSALSNQAPGTPTILEYECNCGCEVVKTVTQLLHHSLHAYRAAPSALSLAMLHQGAVLLCSLSQCGRQFTKQRREIENQYIEVVIGLHVLTKESQDPSYNDDVIQTLWDFDVEYTQYSDDSENAMDTT